MSAGAQSSVACQDGQLELPRGEVLLLGGDLAYPNPSRETFEQRLFVPFQEALPPPPHYHPGKRCSSVGRAGSGLRQRWDAGRGVRGCVSYVMHMSCMKPACAVPLHRAVQAGLCRSTPLITFI